MEPLNLMVSLSHFANEKNERHQYLSDDPRRTIRARAGRRSRRGQAEHRPEDSYGWWRSAWRGVTKATTR
ncbi:hypothetical protein AB0F43_22725 [Kribbella sp. NPDC023972]|uniref:hypothetical protein n=1 Tax=Kribbella sp. NPDC023972 TaxID=3154795 RepID=UPI0033DA05C2